MSHQVIDPETRRFGQLLHGAGAAVVVLGVFLANAFLYAPMVEGLDDTRVEIDKLNADLRSAPTIRDEHAKLKERLDHVTQRMERIRTRVPEDAGVSQFVSQVTKAADQEGITITDFDAGSAAQKNGCSAREITFTGTGRFSSFAQLVDRIRKLPRLTKVTGIEIKSETPGQNIYPIKLRTTIYFGLAVEEAAPGEEPRDE